MNTVRHEDEPTKDCHISIRESYTGLFTLAIVLHGKELGSEHTNGRYVSHGTAMAAAAKFIKKHSLTPKTK